VAFGQRIERKPGKSIRPKPGDKQLSAKVSSTPARARAQSVAQENVGRLPGPRNCFAKRRSGRPRSQVARKAILKAAYHLLKDQGHEGVSTSQLASNAGVSTATLYRWWPTKEAVLLEAFFEAAGEMLPFRQDKSPLARLRKHVVEAARFLKSEHGRVMARLIMAIQEDDELRRGFLQIYYLPRRAAAHAVIQEAIQAGELPSDTDPEILIDALYGPLYARLLLGHAPLDEKFAEKISDLLI
jgi:AcrR family transcriptional regulator